MIISFYSYKGGVGRTQLCANIAAYLCYKKGKKVLLWDWDFEAPGLHYYFDKTNDDTQNGGTLEMLEEYVRMMRANEVKAMEDLKFLALENKIHLVEGDPVQGKIGSIDLIPAGNYTNSFAARVNGFNWYEFYDLLDGVVFIEELKKQIKGMDYDYVLIDSRTGINDYSGLCNIQLPDANVLVMVANNQNLDGSERIINQILDSEYTKYKLTKEDREYKEHYILPILSRIDSNHPDLEKWLGKFEEKFSHLLPKLDTEISTEFISEVFKSFYIERTLLEYVPQYSAGENILIKRERQYISKLSFASKYVTIAEYLENLKSLKKIGIFDQISREEWREYALQAELRSEKRKAGVAYFYAGLNDKAMELNAPEAFMKECKIYIKDNPEKAITYCEKAIIANPEYLDAYITLGIIACNKKKYREAIDYLEKAISIDDQKNDAFFWMGYAYFLLKENHKAKELLLKTIELDKSYSNAFSTLGVIFRIEKSYENSVNYLKRAIKLNSDNADYHKELGESYFSIREMDKAIHSYKRAIEINPKEASTYIAIGKIYFNKERFDDALYYFGLGITNEPNEPDYYYAIGQVYYNKKEYKSAMSSYERAISLDSQNPDYYFSSAKVFYKRKEYTRTISYIEMAINFDSNNALYYCVLGDAYQALNDDVSSAEMYQCAINLDANIADGYKGLGIIYQKSRRYDKAILEYNKAIKISPKADYYCSLGNVYMDILDYVHAKECYEIAINLDPTLAECYGGLGLLDFFDKKYKDSIKNYKEAIKLDPYNAIYHKGLGNVFEKVNYDKGAESCYMLAIMQNPRLAEGYKGLGNLNYKRKEYDLAIGNFNTAISLNPDKLEYYLCLGDAFVRKSTFGKAIACYKMAINLSPKNSICYAKLGISYKKRGNIEDAINVFKNAIKLGNKDFCNLNLGHMYLCKKQENKALTCYQKSLAAFEDKEEFWKVIEDDFQYLEQYGITREYYDSILEKIKKG